MNFNQAVVALSSGEASQARARKYISRLPVALRQQVLQQGLPESLSRPIDPPHDLSVVENCIKLLSRHVDGSYESGLWPEDAVTGVKFELVVPEWCTSVMSAAWVLKEGKEAEAQVLLARFQRDSHTQLQRHDPLIFAFVYTSVLYFCSDHPTIAWQLLRHFRAVAEDLLWPTHHPARLLFGVLYQLGPDQMVSYADKILLAYVDLIQGALGGAYPIVQDMLSDTMMRLLFRGLMSPQQISDLGHNMCAQAVKENRHQNEYYFNLKLHMANARFLMGDNDATKQLLDEFDDPHNKSIQNPRIMVDVHNIRAKLYEREGAISVAIEYLMRALVETIDLDGKEGPHVVNSLILLAEIYDRSGQTGKAKRVREDCDMTLKSLCQMDVDSMNI